MEQKKFADVREQQRRHAQWSGGQWIKGPHQADSWVCDMKEPEVAQLGVLASTRIEENQAARLAMSSSVSGLATTVMTSCRRSPLR